MKTLSSINQPLMRASAAVAVGLTAMAAPMQGQTFTDGNFATPWTTTTIIGGCSGSSATQASGGNPDAYLLVTDNTCTYVANAHMSPFSWNPFLQGAITSLVITADVRSAPNAVAFEAVVRQGGNYFVKNYLIPPTGDWTPLTSGPSAGAWCNVYSTFYVSFTCGAAVLDFSATGGEIDFGIASANSGGVYSADGGIDNFAVELTHDPAPAITGTPEPATWSLVGTGLLGVVGVARRRKRMTQNQR